MKYSRKPSGKCMLGIMLIICVLLVFIKDAHIVKAEGTNILMYSADEFPEDLSHAKSLQNYFDINGYSSMLSERVPLVYALNAHLNYGNSLFISSHGYGEGSKLVLTDNVSYSGADVSSVNCKLVFYSACYSAKTNTTTNINLCARTVTKGADAVVGYEKSITTGQSRYFEKEFYKYLIDEKVTYTTAYTYAKDSVLKKYGSASTVYSSVRLYGNGGLKF